MAHLEDNPFISFEDVQKLKRKMQGREAKWILEKGKLEIEILDRLRDGVNIIDLAFNIDDSTCYDNQYINMVISMSETPNQRYVKVVSNVDIPIDDDSQRMRLTFYFNTHMNVMQIFSEGGQNFVYPAFVNLKTAQSQFLVLNSEMPLDCSSVILRQEGKVAPPSLLNQSTRAVNTVLKFDERKIKKLAAEVPRTLLHHLQYSNSAYKYEDIEILDSNCIFESLHYDEDMTSVVWMSRVDWKRRNLIHSGVRDSWRCRRMEKQKMHNFMRTRSLVI